MKISEREARLEGLIYTLCDSIKALSATAIDLLEEDDTVGRWLIQADADSATEIADLVRRGEF